MVIEINVIKTPTTEETYGYNLIINPGKRQLSLCLPPDTYINCDRDKVSIITNLQK